jgi:hypothetical protein
LMAIPLPIFGGNLILGVNCSVRWLAITSTVEYKISVNSHLYFRQVRTLVRYINLNTKKFIIIHWWIKITTVWTFFWLVEESAFSVQYVFFQFCSFFKSRCFVFFKPLYCASLSIVRWTNKCTNGQQFIMLLSLQCLWGWRSNLEICRGHCSKSNIINRGPIMRLLVHHTMFCVVFFRLT